jgi:hypothetical protein
MNDQKNRLTILKILQLDAQNLFNRIKGRKTEYLMEYSLKRTREHFKEIFKNRYEEVKVVDLKCFDSQFILLLDNFYTTVDEMKWYLNHTQDMNTSMEDKVDWYLRNLKKQYYELMSCVEMEFGREEGNSATLSDEPPLTEDDLSAPPFNLPDFEENP